MVIQFHKKFEKQFKKLPQSSKKKIRAAIQCFSDNPHHPVLRNHPLKGSLRGLHAISAANDLRIVFKEEDNYTLVIMLGVGTHNQVY